MFDRPSLRCNLLWVCDYTRGSIFILLIVFNEIWPKKSKWFCWLQLRWLSLKCTVCKMKVTDTEVHRQTLKTWTGLKVNHNHLLWSQIKRSRFFSCVQFFAGRERRVFNISVTINSWESLFFVCLDCKQLAPLCHHLLLWRQRSAYPCQLSLTGFGQAMTNSSLQS